MTQIVREETCSSVHGLFFSISLCYTSCGALAAMRNSSIGPQWGIDPMTHHIMSRYHGTTLTLEQCLTLENKQKGFILFYMVSYISNICCK